MTDGNLSDVETPPSMCPEVSSPSPTSCPPATTATITLPAPVPADLVVVRGCAGGCRVETSADGRAFRDVGAVGTDDAVVRLPGAPVRAVRVGLGSRGLREVSVWQPTRRSALKAVATDRLQDLRGPYGTVNPDHRLRTALEVLAGILALLAAVSIAFVVGRRGRR